MSVKKIYRTLPTANDLIQLVVEVNEVARGVSSVDVQNSFANAVLICSLVLYFIAKAFEIIQLWARIRRLEIIAIRRTRKTTSHF